MMYTRGWIYLNPVISTSSTSPILTNLHNPNTNEIILTPTLCIPVARRMQLHSLRAGHKSANKFSIAV